MIYLYLLGNIVYLPLALYDFFCIQNLSYFKALVYYIRGILLVGQQYNSWILWYLLSIIYSITVLYILFRKKCKKIYILLTAVFFFCLDH